MDFESRLKRVAQEAGAKLLVSGIPDLIFSQSEIPFLDFQKIDQSGFCNLVRYWLSVNSNVDVFLSEVKNSAREDSIVKGIVDLFDGVDEAELSALLAKRFSEWCEYRAKAFEKLILNCTSDRSWIDLEVVQESYYSRLGLFVESEKFFIDAFAVAVYIRQNPARYQIEVKVCHQAFQQRYNRSGHIFAIQRFPDSNGAIFFDWKGGAYQVEEQSVTKTLLLLINETNYYYSIRDTGQLPGFHLTRFYDNFDDYETLWESLMFQNS